MQNYLPADLLEGPSEWPFSFPIATVCTCVPSRVLCLVVHQLNGKLPVCIPIPCHLVGGRPVVGGEQGPDSSKKVSSGE